MATNHPSDEAESPRLLKLKEAADLLRVCTRTVRRYVAEGRLCAMRTPGGRLLFKRADMLALLQPATTSPASQPTPHPSPLADLADDLTRP